MRDQAKGYYRAICSQAGGGAVKCADDRMYLFPGEVDAAAVLVGQFEQCLREERIAPGVAILEVAVFVVEINVAIERPRSQPGEELHFITGIDASCNEGQ